MQRYTGVAMAMLAALAAACLVGMTSAFLTPKQPQVQDNRQQFQQLSQQMGGVDGSFAPPPDMDAAIDMGRSWMQWLGAGVLAGFIAAVAAAPPADAFADSKNMLTQGTVTASKLLTPCKDSKKFHKKIKDEIYKVAQRQKKYPKGSVVYERFVKKINQIKYREEAYGTRLCGVRDGKPRTIATGELTRGNVVVPGLIFLYTAGWIGWAGRSYLMRTQDEMKELNLDVPLALTCMASGFSWPVAAWQEIVNGEMVGKKESWGNF